MPPKFTLHDVDAAVWQRAEARARAEGWKMGPLVKQLLADYAAGLVSPTSSPNIEDDRTTTLSEIDRGKRMVATQVEHLARNAGRQVSLRWDDEATAPASILTMTSPGATPRRWRFTFSELEDMPGDPTVAREVQERVRVAFAQRP